MAEITNTVILPGFFIFIYLFIYLFFYLFIFLNVEQIMAFALSTNLVREVKNNSPKFKQIE